MKQNRPSQKQIVLNHLEKYGTITSLEGTKKYNIVDIRARIRDLREDGYIINSVMEKINQDGQTIRYARYTLVNI